MQLSVPTSLEMLPTVILLNFNLSVKIATMFHRYILRFAVVLVLLVCVGTGRTQISSGEKQELEMAENAILTRFALLSASPYICSEQPSQCISADGIELGTALVASRDTPQSLRSLVRLRRFRFDASYGESYDEYLCKKGKKLEAYLVKLDPRELRQTCVHEFNSIVKANPKELGAAKLEIVCATEERIRTDLRETLEMVRNPSVNCEP